MTLDVRQAGAVVVGSDYQGLAIARSIGRRGTVKSPDVVSELEADPR